jgi:hypothetical protein
MEILVEGVRGRLVEQEEPDGAVALEAEEAGRVGVRIQTIGW